VTAIKPTTTASINSKYSNNDDITTITIINNMNNNSNNNINDNNEAQACAVRYVSHLKSS